MQIVFVLVSCMLLDMARQVQIVFGFFSHLYVEAGADCFCLSLLYVAGHGQENTDLNII